jgi:two-component system, chemotaxis family, chemotaxis protein CheY
MSKLVVTVDDSKTMRDMVAVTLRSADLDVGEAEDGVKALSVLAAKAADLIITNLNMPNMDGITPVTSPSASVA